MIPRPIPPTRPRRRGFNLRDPDGRLVAKLDEVLRQVRDVHPGRYVSREALTRELLHHALGDRRILRGLGVR